MTVSPSYRGPAAEPWQAAGRKILRLPGRESYGFSCAEKIDPEVVVCSFLAYQIKILPILEINNAVFKTLPYIVSISPYLPTQCLKKLLPQSIVAKVAALIDRREPYDDLDRIWAVLLRLWNAVDRSTP